MKKVNHYFKTYGSAKSIGLFVVFFLIFSIATYAAGSTAEAAMKAATDEIKKLFEPAVLLCTAIGAVIAAVGAVSAFKKKQEGDPHAEKAIAGWISGCVFLVVAFVLIAIFFKTT